MVSWRTRWRIREYVRNSIWIVPGLFAFLAIVAGVVLPNVEFTIGIEYGVEAARSVLGALAGGMITFTGFVFSILLLAVQFGSSQFSPRMLRRFLRDRTTKIALGTFIATFLYSLLVLRFLGRPEEPEFVPDGAISVAMLLLLASMYMFLRLIARTTSGLRVASVVSELADDSRESIEAAYPKPAPEQPERPLDPPPGPTVTVAYRGQPLVLQSVDGPGLVALATGGGVVIELVPATGDLLVEGDPLFRVHGEGAAAIDEEALQGSIAVGDERTLRQDPPFGFRLLADISAKALSPGVNDPSTSIQALDRIEVLLRILGRRQLTPGVHVDAGGVERLRWPAPSWEDYLSLALDETRQYGEGSVQISRRLRALLEHLHAVVPAYRRPAIEAKLDLVEASARRGFSDELDQIAAAVSDPQGIGSSR